MTLNQQLYNSWSATYDRQENKTRDLEKIAAQKTLSGVRFETVIELGCGTGKNTVWLAEKARRVFAVDFSEEMQKLSKQKVKTGNVEFAQADISKPWNFAWTNADLIACSLVLEHIENLDFVFREAFEHLTENGHFYVCELHPFRQYAGSKARFESAEGCQVLECFTHNISDYVQAAIENNFSIVRLNEWFDSTGEAKAPRLVSFLFAKKNGRRKR